MSRRLYVRFTEKETLRKVRVDLSLRDGGTRRKNTKRQCQMSLITNGKEGMVGHSNNTDLNEHEYKYGGIFVYQSVSYLQITYLFTF